MFLTFYFFHLAMCWAMSGIAGFSAIAFYPQLKLISKKRFQEFEVSYLKKTLWIILPLIILEGVSAVLVWYTSFRTMLYYPMFINFILLIVTWVISFKRCMKHHQKLAMEGYNAKVHNQLMQANIWRTGIWAFRAVALLILAWVFWN